MILNHNLRKILMVIALIFSTLSIMAVEMQLTFTSTLNGYHYELDSIEVINITQKDTLVMFYPDTVLSFGDTNGTYFNELTTQVLSSNYPNPFAQSTNFNAIIEQDGLVTIEVYSISGKLVCNYIGKLSPGAYQFKFSSNETGLYIIKATTGNNTSTIKAICNSRSASGNAITLNGKISSIAANKSIKLKSSEEFVYAEGDTLQYTGYMTNGRNYKKRLQDIPTVSQDYVFDISWYYWDNPQRGLEAAYLPMVIDGLYKRMTPVLMDLRSDEAYTTSAWYVFPLTANFTVDVTYDQLYWPWREAYIGVLRANEILEYYPKMEMDENLRNRMMGEAYFLRGFYYYQLLNLYREIPIYDHLIKDGAEFKIAQVSRDSAWNYVINDFITALPMLPTKENADAADSLNATCGSVAAYLAKSYVLTEQWQNASDILSAIIAGNYGSYTLMENYKDNFTKAGEHNAESLFEIIFTFDLYGTAINHGWITSYGNEDNYLLGTARSINYLKQDFGGWEDVLPCTWLKDKFLQDSTLDKKYDPRLAATFYFDSGIEDGLSDSNQFIKEYYSTLA